MVKNLSYIVLAGVLAVSFTVSQAYAAKTPQDALKQFKSFYQQLDNAGDIESVYRIHQQYGDKTMAAKAQQALQKPDPQSGKLIMSVYQKELKPLSTLQFEEPKILGDSAMITYKASGQPDFEGKAELHYEGNAWKMVSTKQTLPEKKPDPKFKAWFSF